MPFARNRRDFAAHFRLSAVDRVQAAKMFRARNPRDVLRSFFTCVVLPLVRHRLLKRQASMARKAAGGLGDNAAGDPWDSPTPAHEGLLHVDYSEDDSEDDGSL